jgi:hypothetical protein
MSTVLYGIGAIAIYFAILYFVMAPFRLSSRISREEEAEEDRRKAEEYMELVERIQKLHNRNAANDAEKPIKIVHLVGP